MNTIISILISVIGGIIVILLTPAFSWLKKLFTNIFGNHKRNKQIEKFGIISIEETREKAFNKILSDIKKSDKIDSLSFKGGMLFDGKYNDQSKFHDLYTKSVRHPKRYRFLLLSSDSVDSINSRNNDLKQYKISIEEHCNQINQCISYLETKKNVSKSTENIIEYRVFRESLKWSLLMSDKFILLNFYEKKTKGAKALCYIIKKESLFGNTIVQYFDDLWKRSDTPQLNMDSKVNPTKTSS